MRLLISLFALLLAWPFSAQASQDLYIYKVTCAPELNFFGLETGRMSYDDFSGATDQARAGYGIYKMHDPQTCSLGDREISYKTDESTTGKFDLVFSVDAEEVFRFPVFFDRDDIQIFAEHVVRIQSIAAQHCWYSTGVYRRKAENFYSDVDEDFSDCETKYWDEDEKSYRL